MKSIKIGKSFLGNSLNVDFVGDEKSSFRIFIMAGQHGDENYSVEAVSKLLYHYRTVSKCPFFAAILSNANPDGYKNHSRMNAQSIDLNRDHLLTQSKENEAIHSFVRQWRPQIVIDVHNYPSRRKHLLKKRLIINQDIFLDVPTNPAVIPNISDKKIDEFIENVKLDLHNRGFSCERYLIFRKSGQIRHSTLDLKDARNFLALRYGLFSIILEGKEPLKKEGISGRNKTIESQFFALQSIIDYLVQNRNNFNFKPHVSSKGELVPIRTKYSNPKTIEIDIKNSKTKDTSKKTFQKYSSDIEISRFISLPIAYGIPSSMTQLIKLMKKHGFSSSNDYNFSKYQKYYYKISEKTSKKRIKKKTIEDKISNYVVFPINQPGGRFLALLLEPQSKFGLHRFSELIYSKSLEYPIIRI